MALDDDTFQLLEGSVQRFIQDRLVPTEDHVEEHDEVPPEIVRDMKELGLFRISIPEEYGGIGLSMAQECEVAYELGQTALAFPFRGRHQHRHRLTRYPHGRHP